MTREEELIELLDKKTVADDAALCPHPSTSSLQEQQIAIEATFRAFGLQGHIVHAYCAPQVNCYDFAAEEGERLFTYANHRCEIQMAVKSSSNIRMVLPVPGQCVCRLEVPRERHCRPEVTAGELFRSKEWSASRFALPLMLGKGLNGENILMDLAKAPHLLMAGRTGTGKSILLDSCIISLMFRHTPDELKLILVDSKSVEFNKYNDLPYLQFPVINSIKDTLCALQWLNIEMDRRDKMLSETGCRDIKTLNRQRTCPLPYIVMMIDDFTDFTFQIEVRTQMEKILSQLCAKARSVGIHLIISTQRPNSQTLPKAIMVNFPVRIAFQVACGIDSRKILDANDATSLLGFGDMLFRGPDAEGLMRIQGGYLSDQESARILERLKSMYGDMKPNALPPMLSMERDQMEILHDMLAYSARGILEEKLEWLKYDVIDEITRVKDTSAMEQLETNVEWLFNDSIIDEASDAVADSIIQHWDELKAVTSDVDEEPNRDDVVESDLESDEGLSNDESKLLLEAVQVVIESRRPTASFIQRQLKVGYNKASALLETMERHGIVSPQRDSEMRSVLVNSYEEALSRLPKQN